MKRAFSFLILIALLSSCKKEKSVADSFKEDVDALCKESFRVFEGKVVVILADSLDPKSSTIRLQDYTRHNASFIPIFSSMEKFEESSQGQVKNKVIAIDGILLLSILRGDEMLYLNPDLQGGFNFKASAPIKIYEKEIEQLKAKHDSLKK